MSILQISKIQHRSGNLVDLPQLDEAEFGWASDEKRLFIGKTTPNENIEVLTSYSRINFDQINGSVGNLSMNPVSIANGQVMAFDGTNWTNKGGIAGGLITLGEVSNVKINGGSVGYVLETDGTGNLAWTPKATIVAYIQNVTKTTPPVVTTVGDNFFVNSAEITITDAQGMTQLNGNTYYSKILTSDTLELYTDPGLTTPLDTSTFSVYAYSAASATTFSTNIITVTTSAPFTVNAPVRFTGDITNTGLENDKTYYVKTKPSGTQLTVSSTLLANGTAGTATPLQTTTGLSIAVYQEGGRLISAISGSSTSGGAAEGANTSIQYNRGGLLGGDGDFTWAYGASKVLTVNGNVNIANLNATGAVSGTRFISSVATGTAPLTVNSTTRVANLNVASANVADFTLVTARTTGVHYPVFASGSTTGNYSLGSDVNISFDAATNTLVVPTANVVTINAGNIAATGNITAGGNFTVTGNITASRLISTVATGTAPLSVTSTTRVANLNVADALTAGTVTTNAQPNITSVGTLTDLTVSGTVKVGTVTSLAKTTIAGPSGSTPQLAVGTPANNNLYVHVNDSGYLSLHAGLFNSTALDFGTVTNQPLLFKTNNSERMRISASGNIGIGTSAPNSKLHIVGQDAVLIEGSQPFITLTDTSGANRKSRIRSDNGYFYVSRDVSGTGTFLESLSIADSASVAVGYGPSNGYNNVRYFDIYNDFNGSGSAVNFRLITQGDTTTLNAVDMYKAKTGGFLINNNNASLNAYFALGVNGERMRISSNGNIGIGTSAPSSILEIRRDQATTTDVRIKNSSTSNSAASRHILEAGSINSWVAQGLYYNTGGAQYLVSSGTDVSLFSQAALNHRWLSRDGTTEWMRIDSSGNLGLGTVTPNALFEMRKDQNDATISIIRNATIGTNAIARLQLIGGTPNSYLSIQLHDNNGNPNVIIGAGAAPTAIHHDANRHIFRSAAGSEWGRFNNNGFFGIGTNNPGYKLEVFGTNDVARFATAGSNVAVLYADPSYTIRTGMRDGGFIVDTSNTERLRVAANGFVGAGTMNPQSRMHISDNTSTVYTGYVNQSASSSAANYRGLFYDFRNEHNQAVAMMLSDVYVDGRADIAFSVTAPGARTNDRRVERMRITADNTYISKLFVYDPSTFNSSLTVNGATSVQDFTSYGQSYLTGASVTNNLNVGGTSTLNVINSNTITSGTTKSTVFRDGGDRSITAFDPDGTMGTNTDSYLPTQRAVVTYVGSQITSLENRIPGVPTGSVFHVAMQTAPDGYLIADGTLYDRRVYVNLFSAIGYIYGGSGFFFNVPDLRGQFIRGIDNGRGVDPSRAFGTTQASAYGSHAHFIMRKSTPSEYEFEDVAAGNTGALTAYSSTGGDNQYSLNGTTLSAADRALTSYSGASETRPTNVAMLPIIKT